MGQRSRHSRGGAGGAAAKGSVSREERKNISGPRGPSRRRLRDGRNGGRGRVALNRGALGHFFVVIVVLYVRKNASKRRASAREKSLHLAFFIFCVLCYWAEGRVCVCSVRRRRVKTLKSNGRRKTAREGESASPGEGERDGVTHPESLCSQHRSALRRFCSDPHFWQERSLTRFLPREGAIIMYTAQRATNTRTIWGVDAGTAFL